MKENNQSQSLNDALQQQHPGKQVDGPDEIIVNEQVQNIEVNPQDDDALNKEKGYTEGNKKDPDTDDVTTPAKNNKEKKEEK